MLGECKMNKFTDFKLDNNKTLSVPISFNLKVRKSDNCEPSYRFSSLKLGLTHNIPLILVLSPKSPYSGNVKEDQVLKAFQIITSDKNVKAILVNVFGGIVNCATIANGIVKATQSINLGVPLIVRLEGNNADNARKILKDSGLNIQTASDLDDAARKACAALN